MVVAPTDEDERTAGDHCLPAGILDQGGLADAGLAAEDDEAALPGKRRAELRAGEFALARARSGEVARYQERRGAWRQVPHRKRRNSATSCSRTGANHTTGDRPSTG
jgi:hypothetical protein